MGHGRKRTFLDNDNHAQDNGRNKLGDDKGGGFTFMPASTDGGDLSIASIPTSKDNIEQPELAKHENMYIPPLGSSVVISGKSGSGKSTLLANLVKDERFYGKSTEKPNGWFDKIFLFSPTANGDDVQKSLEIPKKYVFTDLEEAPELLEAILDTQQTKLEDGDGADTVPQYLIIFDDIIGDTKFMNTKAFTRCFYQVRHANCTTIICTQHFKRVPKVCRLQANFIFFFQGSAAEVEMVTEEFAPPSYSKREFEKMVMEATKGKFHFFTINMKIGWDKRFRRNLDEFISLDRLKSEDEESDKNTDKGCEKDKENNNTQQNDTSKDCVEDTKVEDRIPNAIATFLRQSKHAQYESQDYGRRAFGAAGGRPNWGGDRY
jgi:hypothetical protein